MSAWGVDFNQAHKDWENKWGVKWGENPFVPPLVSGLKWAKDKDGKNVIVRDGTQAKAESTLNKIINWLSSNPLAVVAGTAGLLFIMKRRK